MMNGQQSTSDNFDFQLDENGVIGRRVTSLLAEEASKLDGFSLRPCRRIFKAQKHYVALGS